MALPETKAEIEAAYLINGALTPVTAATMAKDAVTWLQDSLQAYEEAEAGGEPEKRTAAKKAQKAIQVLDRVAEVVTAAPASEFLGPLVNALDLVRSVSTVAFNQARDEWLRAVREDAGL